MRLRGITARESVDPGKGEQRVGLEYDQLGGLAGDEKRCASAWTLHFLLPEAERLIFTDGIPATEIVFVENARRLDVSTPLCSSVHVLVGASASPPPDVVDLHRRGTLRRLAPFLLPSAVPFPQRLARLLRIEENLRTLHDGDEDGVGITIGCLVPFKVHQMNADGGCDLVREEVGEVFTQACASSLQRVPEAVRAERDGKYPDMSSLWM